MNQTKTHKTPISSKNRVTWTDRNYKFIREHSISYPKPSWSVTHTIGTIVALIFFFVLFLLTHIPIFAGNLPFKVAAILISAILFILYAADAVGAGNRLKKFYNELLARGGKIVDPQNLTLVNKGFAPANILLAASFVMFCFYTVFLLYAVIDRHLQDIRHTPYGNFFCFFVIQASLYNKFSPYIFMGADEGMFFGGALFSYDVLKGITPTGQDSFELYFDGKKVAEGIMAPDDMKYLQDMLEIRGRANNALQ